MPRALGRPLRSWRLTVPLRGYQEDLLAAVSPHDGATLHLVAPPGAGKTLLGLALARANGRRALVLAPTAVIKAQWAAQAERFMALPGSTRPEVGLGVPEPGRPVADLTAETYQALAVVDDAGTWEEAARRRWIEQLVAGGRSPRAARDWLARLGVDNPTALASGLRSRAATIRSRAAELDDDAVAELLHPAARARLDALVEAGVSTLVLDECHHLRAHWALVVRYLSGRLTAAGHAPTLIGLTATAPSSHDSAWRRYHALLGEVDAEIPVPAVIRAGHLAPARSLVHFTLPTPEETAFLSTAGRELRHRLGELLGRPDGVDYLLDVVAPEPQTYEPGDAGTAPLHGAEQLDDTALVRRIVVGFDADPTLASAASAVLRRTKDYTPTPLSTLVVPLLPELDTLDVAEELRLLGSYALERLLPDPTRRHEWEEIRGLLRGFGLHLTDTGIRWGRSPLDVLTAGSRAKDTAVIDVLRLELDAIGDRLRALVVTDAAERSAAHRALDVRTALGPAGAAGGALRCFEVILSDARLRDLHPVLLTSRHLRLASQDAGLLAELRERTGLELPARDDGWMLAAPGAGAGSAPLVMAVGELVNQGRVRLVVGTRGLLGEGWDCPAINTLVDLSTVTTSTATEQLRGRTIRLDPAWPGKVAHIWSVTCLLPATLELRANPDLERLRRKAEHIWSLPRLRGETDPQVLAETGLGGMLTDAQVAALEALDGGAGPAAVQALNATTAAGLGDRDQERSRWLTRSQDAGASRSAPAGRGRVVEVVHIESAPRLLRRGAPADFWTAAARAVLSAMTATGRVGGGEEPAGPGDPSREQPRLRVSGTGDLVTVGLDGADALAATAFANAVVELLTPATGRPRFALECATATLAARGRPLGVLRRLIGRALAAGGWGLPERTLMLAVPAALARSRADMEALDKAWRSHVGPCRVHLVRDADDLAALVANRGRHGPASRVRVRRSRQWIETP